MRLLRLPSLGLLVLTAACCLFQTGCVSGACPDQTPVIRDEEAEVRRDEGAEVRRDEEAEWQKIESQFASFEGDAYLYDGAGETEKLSHLVDTHAATLMQFIAVGSASWLGRFEKVLHLLDTVGGMGWVGREALLSHVLESVIHKEGLSRAVEDSLLRAGESGLSLGLKFGIIAVLTPRSAAARKFIAEVNAYVDGGHADRYFVSFLCRHRFESEFRVSILEWLGRRAKSIPRSRTGSPQQLDILWVLDRFTTRLASEEKQIKEQYETLNGFLR